MRYGDRITINGQKYKIQFVYEDYILVSLLDVSPENVANGTFVFRVKNKDKLVIVDDKEEIKIVLTKLFEEAQRK